MFNDHHIYHREWIWKAESSQSRVKSYLEIEDRFYALMMMLFNLELFLIGGRYLKFNDYIEYRRLIC